MLILQTKNSTMNFSLALCIDSTVIDDFNAYMYVDFDIQVFGTYP